MKITSKNHDVFGSFDVFDDDVQIGTVTNEPEPGPNGKAAAVFVARNLNTGEVRKFSSKEEALGWFRGDPPLISN